MKGKMDLLSELQALQAERSRQGLPCSAKTLLDALDEKERETVENILEEHTYPITALLKVRGAKIGNARGKSVFIIGYGKPEFKD